jgi:site-specific DNA-methyltransferase (adenine-specific)
MLTTNKIYCGDCLEVMRDIADKSIDMILCDLPYGTTACKWDTVIPFEPLWEQYKRIIKDNGAIVLTASQPFTSALVMSNIKMFKYELIWNKKHGKAPGVAKYRPMPSHENIIVFGNAKNTYNPQMAIGQPYTDIRSSNKRKSNEHKFGYGKGFSIKNKGTRYPLSILDFLTAPFEGQHPTQKPVALFEYLVKTYTNEGDVVLDNCIGSGTTAIACLNTGRNYIGIEQDEQYYKLAQERIQQHSAQMRLW